VAMVRYDANREGVRIEQDLAAEPDWVLVQQIQIEQVLLNLARNAIEAMSEVPQERRRLTIRTRGDGRRIEVSVADTGPGLNPDIEERVFEPFVTTKAKGMGLGLSISAGIIEAHGGQLTVDSSPGQGTEFSFSLKPARPPEQDNTT